MKRTSSRVANTQPNWEETLKIAKKQNYEQMGAFRRRPNVYFFTIPFAILRGTVMRTFLGKFGFYWALMVLAEQW